MPTLKSRREFCRNVLATAGMMAVPTGLLAAEDWPNQVSGIPLTDYHVHRDGTTVEKLLEISRQRGVKFGIVEHAGKRENDYPIILSNDDELGSYIASLEGKPVFKGGVQGRAGRVPGLDELFLEGGGREVGLRAH